MVVSGRAPRSGALLHVGVHDDSLSTLLCSNGGVNGQGRFSASALLTEKTHSMGAERRFQWDKASAAADAIADEEIARTPGLPAADEGD
jgi:hypothetical protein